MDISAMSDREVVDLMLGQTLEATVRRMLHESSARIDQAHEQAQGPTGVQVRRMELEDAVAIIKVVNAAECSRIRQRLLEALAAIKARGAHFLTFKPDEHGQFQTTFLEKDVVAALDKLCPE